MRRRDFLKGLAAVVGCGVVGAASVRFDEDVAAEDWKLNTITGFDRGCRTQSFYEVYEVDGSGDFRCRLVAVYPALA